MNHQLKKVNFEEKNRAEAKGNGDGGS
jgi:hypothetical protein